MIWTGNERRGAIRNGGLEEQVRCTVRAFHNFRREEFIPLRNDVRKLDEVLEIVKFLKTGFKVTSWTMATGAAIYTFLKTTGLW